MQSQTLYRLSSKEISKKEAYGELFPKPVRVPGPKRAHFVRIHIVIPDQKGVTAFLGFLFLLPVPLFFARIALKYVKQDEDMPLDGKELMRLIAVRGLKVDVQTHDGTKVYIKTI
ncbi:MAG: hypothetical protein V1761_03265 [bacterium]